MTDHQFEFQQVHDEYHSRILRYLARLAGPQEAEDLAQEVFLKVSRALPEFRGEASLSTWLYRIATNTAIDRLRSRAASQIAQGELPGGEDHNTWTGEKAPTVEQQLVRKEMNACIRDFIERLPLNYRSVLVLSELEGLRSREIAEVLGISLGTVKIRLHRARQALRQELQANCDSYWIEENEYLPDMRRALQEYRKTNRP